MNRTPRRGTPTGGAAWIAAPFVAAVTTLSPGGNAVAVEGPRPPADERAAVDGAGEAERAFRAARAAEAAADFDEAVRRYEAVRAVAPAGARSAAARARLAWMGARRDRDGGFSALRELDAVRRGLRTSPAGEARARVAAVAADGGASPVVRAEAGAWLAQDALGRKDPGAALRATEEPWAAREGLPADVRGLLALRRAEALARLGRWDEGREVEAEARRDQPTAGAGLEAGARPGRRSEGAVARVARDRTRTRLGWAAWSGIGLFGVAAVPAAVRGWSLRPRPRPWGALPLGVLALGGGAIASAYEAGAGRAFPALAAALVAVHLVAAGAAIEARASGTPARRGAVVGVLAAWASLGAAFLVLRAHEALVLAGL